MLNVAEFNKSHTQLMKKAATDGTNCTVSTITVICTLRFLDYNCQELNLSALQKVMINLNYDVKLPKRSDKHITKRGVVKKSFFNQLTISFVDGSKKSIKFFLNGKMQMTGLKNYDESNQLCEKLVDILNNHLNANVQMESMCTPLINLSFKVPWSLKMEKLQHVILADGYYCRFQPESYPGLVTKYSSGNNTILVFGSGSIMVAGSGSIDDAITAYDYITSVIKKNPSVHSTLVYYNPKHNKKCKS